MFTERNMPVTVYGVATALMRNPEAVAAMKEADWEIASHGLKWIDYRDFSSEEERAHMKEAIRIHSEVTGERPLGWYTGRTSEHTNRLVAEEGGFLYSADSYADELPYWEQHGARQQLIVPYTLDANDMRFATPQGFNAGDQFFAYLKDSFDTLYAEGETAPKMLSVGLHCRLVGRPGRGGGARPLPGLCCLPRERLGGQAHRHCPPLDPEPPPDGSEAQHHEPRAVRGALRRYIRAFALDCGTHV
jgi:peptidoglycan/xylan/chitin deacetylase (PgdA/CDA1 family)